MKTPQLPTAALLTNYAGAVGGGEGLCRRDQGGPALVLPDPRAGEVPEGHHPGPVCRKI